MTPPKALDLGRCIFIAACLAIFAIGTAFAVAPQLIAKYWL